MFYAEDLARIHDEGFGEFARAGATTLLERIAPPGLVVELGCGTGISSELIAATGFDLVGVDASAAMLERARRRVPTGSFVQDSVWDADIPPCRAVTAFGEVLNYANAGSGELDALFTRVHEALEPGGLFVFDVATPGRGGRTTRTEGAGWAIDADTTEDADRRTLIRHMTFTIDGRRAEETHVLRLHDRDDVRKRLEGLGFGIETLDRYGDFAFWPGYVAFAATKTGTIS
jgi:SAM-dependent methyltransferase